MARPALNNPDSPPRYYHLGVALSRDDKPTVERRAAELGFRTLSDYARSLLKADLAQAGESCPSEGTTSKAS